MKIRLKPFSRKRKERGMMTLVFMVLLTILVIVVTVNVRTLVRLRAEEKLIEQGQVERLTASQTNAVAAARSLGRVESN